MAAFVLAYIEPGACRNPRFLRRMGKTTGRPVPCKYMCDAQRFSKVNVELLTAALLIRGYGVGSLKVSR